MTISECMRRNGVPDFPDPTTTPPGNIQNYSIAEGIGDTYLLVLRTLNVTSPTFTQVAKTCNFR